MNGIPALFVPKPANAAISLLGAAQGIAWNMASYQPSWGVFKSGTSEVATPVDSVIDMSQRKGSMVSDYKIESGSFASFNKVEKPREVMIRLSRGGAEMDRTEFLAWLQINSRAPTLFDVAMPEQIFSDMTLMEYSQGRDVRSGVTIVFADCLFREIRQVAPQYSSSNKRANTENAAAPEDKPASQTAKTEWKPLTSGTAGSIPSVLGWQIPSISTLFSGF